MTRYRSDGGNDPRIHGPRWRALRLAILERDNWTCYRCGRPANTVDHVTGRREGGTNHPSNLRAACRHCNSGYLRGTGTSESAIRRRRKEAEDWLAAPAMITAQLSAPAPRPIYLGQPAIAAASTRPVATKPVGPSWTGGGEYLWETPGSPEGEQSRIW